MNIKQYAVVRGRDVTGDKVAPYLPSNYRVLWEGDYPAFDGDNMPHVVVIEGRDNAGWTMHGYVLPRLGSGLMAAEVIDLSHPIMKEIDA